MNNTNVNKSIFNHNINIPRYIIIEYLHQCILYLTPYTFNVHELIHILLSNVYLPLLSPSNDHKFDSEFCISYTILFGTISGNIHNINVPKTPETNTEECHKLRQTIAKNDVLDSFISMKKQLEFEGHELLYLGYINACLFKHSSAIEAKEYIMFTNTNRNIVYYRGIYNHQTIKVIVQTLVNKDYMDGINNVCNRDYT